MTSLSLSKSQRTNSLGEDKRSLAALGFLTLGRRFLNNRNDIADDRIDVVCRGTLGLTVTCARCHDHKFDPIPTKDYYALHGIFVSSEEPAELPLLQPLRDTAEYKDYLVQKAKIQKELLDFKQKEIDEFVQGLRRHVGDYLLGARDAAALNDSAKFDTFAGEHKLNPAVLRRWMKYLDTGTKTERAALRDRFGPQVQPGRNRIVAQRQRGCGDHGRQTPRYRGSTGWRRHRLAQCERQRIHVRDLHGWHRPGSGRLRLGRRVRSAEQCPYQDHSGAQERSGQRCPIHHVSARLSRTRIAW